MAGKQKISEEDGVNDLPQNPFEIPVDDDDDQISTLLQDTEPGPLFPTDDQTFLSQQAAQNVSVDFNVQFGAENLPRDVQSAGNYNLPQNFDISQNVPQDHVQMSGVCNPNLLSPDMNFNMLHNFQQSSTTMMSYENSNDNFLTPELHSYHPPNMQLQNQNHQVHHPSSHDALMPYANFSQTSTRLSNPNMNFSMPEVFDNNNNNPIPNSNMLLQNKNIQRYQHPRGICLPITSPLPILATPLQIPGQHNFQQYASHNVAGNVLQNVRPKRKRPVQQGIRITEKDPKSVRISEEDVAQTFHKVPREVITAENVPKDAENVQGRVRLVVETSPALNDTKHDVVIMDKSSVNELMALLVEKGKIPAEEKCFFVHKQKVVEDMHRSLHWHGVKDGDSLSVFQGWTEEDRRDL